MVTDGNLVEDDIVGSETGLPGRITIHADSASSEIISDRTVARIEFKVLDSKTSELTISSTLSYLTLDSSDLLDTTTLEPFVLNSTGVVTPTTVPVTPTPSITPITAINSPEGLMFIIGGTLLVISGILLRRKVKENS